MQHLRERGGVKEYMIKLKYCVGSENKVNENTVWGVKKGKWK